MPWATETQRQDSMTLLRSVAFSKKLENHAAAVALSLHALQFRADSQDVACYSAMAAGVSDHVWSIGKIVNVLEIAEDLQHAA